MSSYGSLSPSDEGFDRYEPAFYCPPPHQGSPMDGAMCWAGAGLGAGAGAGGEGREFECHDVYHESAHYIGRTHGAGYEEMQMQNEPYDGYHHLAYPQNGAGMDCDLQPLRFERGGGGPSFVRVVKRRTTANKKERRRTQSINTAFSDLRECIPNVPPDTKLSKLSHSLAGAPQMVRKRSHDINAAFGSLRRQIPHVLPDTKMTKIKTLRLATSYISYLLKALQTDEPCAAFRADTAHAPPRRRHDAQGADRRGKGRTGWPQHVWALELSTEPSAHS